MPKILVDRFRGDDGRPRLIQALRGQALVCDEADIAMDLAALVEIIGIDPPSILIHQGAGDNDLYLILSGEVSIQVNGREIARRRTNQHIGELAVIDPRAARAATVLPTATSVIAKISEKDFSSLAEQYPRLWRRIAQELGDRLRERNQHVLPRRERPVLFIGSSRESLPVAQQLKSCFDHYPLTVQIWTDGVFGASHFPLEDLEAQLAASDFAVLVATPDDTVSSRGRSGDAPRDNIVFELGLFMGALTRHRSFILRPRGVDLKVPTDLLGLTPAEYDSDASVPLSDRLASVCEELKVVITRLGSR
jgi:CRP/FNR family transcriptional regulator, cyclic AMP receptor protein